MRVSGSENLGLSHFGPFLPSIGGLKRTNFVPPLNGYPLPLVPGAVEDATAFLQKYPETCDRR